MEWQRTHPKMADRQRTGRQSSASLCRARLQWFQLRHDGTRLKPCRRASRAARCRAGRRAAGPARCRGRSGAASAVRHPSERHARTHPVDSRARTPAFSVASKMTRVISAGSSTTTDPKLRYCGQPIAVPAANLRTHTQCIQALVLHSRTPSGRLEGRTIWRGPESRNRQRLVEL